MPRSITARKASRPVMAGPPARPNDARTARTWPASSTRPISAVPSSAVSRRTRMFSAGRRSQTGSSRPQASQNRDSRCVGISAISASQSARQRSSPAASQFEAAKAARSMVSRPAGRTSRTRSCTPPSSSMREDAGIWTAARPERALTTSRGAPSGPGRSAPARIAASAPSGSSRSRRRISTSSVAAPAPGCSRSVSRPAIASESAVTVSTPRSKVPASTACAMPSAMRRSSSAKSAFCSSIGRASRRLRNLGIGGRSSRSAPSWTILRPVASRNRSTVQPSIRPCQSAP